MVKIPQPIDQIYRVWNTEIIEMIKDLVYVHKLSSLDAIMTSQHELAIKFREELGTCDNTKLESIYIDLYFLQYEIYKEFYCFIKG